MITSYEVGAVFKIVDQASSTLKLISTQFKELDALILRTKENMTAVSSTRFAGLANRLKLVNEQMASLAGNSEKALGGVMTGFGAMGREIDGAVAGVKLLKTELASLSVQSRSLGGAFALPGPGGRAHPRPGRSGGSGGGGGGSVSMSHSLPGNVSMRESGAANVAGWSVLGGLSYGAYEEAKMQDAIFHYFYHTGLDPTEANKNIFRSRIQTAMSESGMPMDSLIEAAKTESRMMKSTPGNGVGILPEMLRAATIEARLKGETPQEAMKAIIGYAHMMKVYDEPGIAKLAPAFAFLSSANPDTLGSMEKASGYAIPVLQSGLEIDPITTMMLGTALTRAGATSTKSGTWLRNMLLGAMPGSSVVGDPKKHHDALIALGLIDRDGKPTWFTDGKPDALKMMDVASAHAANIPLADRAAIEKHAFGVQGFGAFALLADPAVRQQVAAMEAERNSPEFKHRYATFQQEYNAKSPVQQARTAWSNLQNVMMDLGSNLLPPVTMALSAFNAVLKDMKEHLGGGYGPTVAGAAAVGGLALTKFGRAALAWGGRTATAAALPFFATAGGALLGVGAAVGGLAAIGAREGLMTGAVGDTPGAFVPFSAPLGPGQKPLLGLPAPTPENLEAAKEASRRSGEQSSKALKEGFNPISFQQTGETAAMALLRAFARLFAEMFAGMGGSAGGGGSGIIQASYTTGGGVSFGGAARSTIYGGGGGAVPVGTGTGSAVKRIIDAAAMSAGIDPRVMYGIVAGESAHGNRYDWNGKGEDSWSMFQLNRHGGLGATFERETGLSVRDPKNIGAIANWTAHWIAKHRTLSPWRGFHGMRNWDSHWGNMGYSEPSYVPPPAANNGGHQSNVYLDGRKVGNIIERRIARRHAVPHGTNTHDGSASWSPVDAVNI